MSLREELEKILMQLKLNVPAALLSDEPLTDRNWNSVCQSIGLLTDAIKSIVQMSPDVPPAGFCYNRFPGMKSPTEQFPLTKKNQWVPIHELYPGDFMRLAGGNASTFKADSAAITYDAGVKGSGGGQVDTVQEHTHGYTDASFRSGDTAGGYRSTFYDQNQNKETKVNSGRVSIETRPVNITIEVYMFLGF